MYCPLCQAEYREGFTCCKDCGVPLVSLSESAAESADSHSNGGDAPVLLWRGGNPVEYTALVAALRDAAISFNESFPRDFENAISSRSADRLYYGIPGIDIRVHRRDLLAGQRVLEAVQKQQSKEFEVEAYALGAQPAEDAGSFVERAANEQSDRTAASVSVWSGKDEALAEFILGTLNEHQIVSRIVEGSAGESPLLILVCPRDESRAREILREITEGAPMQ